MTSDQGQREGDPSMSQVNGARPNLTLGQAQKACSVSRSTLKRRIASGEFPDAFRDPPGTGQWLIPVDNLISAGLHPNKMNQTSATQSTKTTQGHAPPIEPADSVVADLLMTVVKAEMDRDRWKATAEERRERIEDLRGALRMLDPGPSAGVTSFAWATWLLVVVGIVGVLAGAWVITAIFR